VLPSSNAAGKSIRANCLKPAAHSCFGSFETETS
jgi:hypothetical protein